MNGLEAVEVQCPYCGEPTTVVVDCSVASQEYTEDCSVCCRPMVLNVHVGEEGISVIARQENE